MKNIEITDRKWIEKCRDYNRNPFTTFAFQSLFTWKDNLGLSIEGSKDYFVVYSEQDKGYFYPCGKEHRCREWINKKMEENEYFKILYLTKRQAKELEELGFVIKHEDGLSEYIYKREALALEKGYTRNYARKIKRFEEGTYTVKPMEAGVPKTALNFYDKLITEKKFNRADFKTVENTLKNYEELGLAGLEIEFKDDKYACIIGYENSSDTFTMTSVMYSKELPADVINLCIYEFAKQLDKKYKYIDLEEDLGKPGLRKMKMLMGPSGMKEVYSAEYNLDRKYPAMNSAGRDYAYFVSKMFRSLFFPAALSSVGLAASNIIDAVTVGQRLGAAGVAAVGIVTPIYSLFNTVGVGFAVGGSIMYAQKMAAADEDGAVRTYSNLLEIIFIISVAFAILGSVFINPVLGVLGVHSTDGLLYIYSRDYAVRLIGATPLFLFNLFLYEHVRTDDDPVLAMVALSTGSVLDVALNILFVLILNMGIMGMVWATILAQTVCFFILLMHFLLRRGKLHFQLVPVSLIQACKDSSAGFASSVRYLFGLIALLVPHNLLMRSTQVDGELYVAVLSVVINVTYIGFSLFQAAADAGTPLFATFYSEHDMESTHNALFITILYGLIVGSIPCIVMSKIPGMVSALFGIDQPATLLVSNQGIRLYCIGAIFGGVSMIMQAYCQSTNREKEALIYSTLKNLVIVVPVGAFIILTNAKYFFYTFPIVDIASALITALICRLMHTGWKIDNHKTISFNLNNIGDVEDVLEEALVFCRDLGVSAEKANMVNNIAKEVCTTIIRNGFVGEENEHIRLTLVYDDKEDFILNLRDSTKDFDIFEVLAEETDEEFVGINAIKDEVKDFYYRNYRKFNVFHITI